MALSNNEQKKLKIALIGEYSGIHAGLKTGLEELGHHVDVYSSGDGFKRIKRDIRLQPISNKFSSKLRFYVYELTSTLKQIAQNYDIIQMVNPHAISSMRGSSLHYGRLIRVLGKTKAVKSLAVVGCEANVQRGLSAISRSPCPGCLNDHSLQECPYTSKNNVKIMQIAEEFSDHIIPFGGPTYAKSYQNNIKYRGILPFCVDLSVVPNRKNLLGGKIKVVHGITRSGFKGTDTILEALKKVEMDYPEVFEVIIPDRLPFSDYVKLLSSANVVVDQLYGDGLGMNALYSMGASCVVFTSFDRVQMGALNLKQAPAIQLGENVAEIYNQIVQLKEWGAHRFMVEGQKSRDFVINNNSPIKIAEKFLAYISYNNS